MPIVGYCHDCAEWVWVTGDLACPKGHPAARVNGWHDSGTGQSLTPSGTATSGDAPAHGSEVAARARGTRTGFLVDLMAALARGTAYSTAWGTDTDLTIASNPVDPVWGSGEQRAVYSAALRVSDGDRIVHFWEALNDHATGAAFGTPADTESGDSVMTEALGPGSASWDWGYGTTLNVVEEVATRHGFTVQRVLTRRAVTW